MDISRNILLTGASGFVGSTLRSLLVQQDYQVRSLIRRAPGSFVSHSFVVADITTESALSSVCEGVDCVIHLAGRAHQLRDSAAEPLAAFRKVNVDGSMNLARTALAAGVKRFIFVSSIGVNGAYTTEQPFTESSAPDPHADYAVSKLEAEQKLTELVQGTGMELVIIRPPLVYAGHAPGNFQRILKLIATGVPLPFGAINNQRSMVALPNLVDFILLCVTQKEAANQLFLVSDGIDVSIREIVQQIALGMGKRARLWPVPATVLKGGAQVLMRPNLYTQLCGSLLIDSSKARKFLAWEPAVTPQQALYAAGYDYKQALGR